MNKRVRAGLAAGPCLLAALLTAGCMPAPATENTPESGSPMPSSIVDPYLKIQTALSSDSIDAVKANAGNIATASTSLGAPAFKIGTAATQLSAAAELPDARDRFGVLSDAIITYMDGLHLTPPAGVKIAMCETTRKQWLQEGDAVANPYEGSSGTGCGSFR
jgi:hypothetical protein